jgi:hypothetical protein
MDLDEDQLVDLTLIDWNDITEQADAKDISRMMNEIAVNEIVLGVPYDFADDNLLCDSSCCDQTVSREPESLFLFTSADERREIFVSFDNDCYFIDTSLSRADEVKKFHVSTFNEQFHQPMGEGLFLGQQDSNDDLYQIFSGPKAENRQRHIPNLEEALSSRRAVIGKDNLLPSFTPVRPSYPVSRSFSSASVFNLACVKKKLTSPGSSYVQRLVSQNKRMLRRKVYSQYRTSVLYAKQFNGI